MYITLNDWVEKYVGKTAAERQQTIMQCGGIPPLFNICTMFNKDMVEDEHEEKNNVYALNQRWNGRLIKASGGIHTIEEAKALIAAGADRLGASSLVSDIVKRYGETS
jgi:hypothetical protein